MKRLILQSLIDWKNRKRKPLIIRGARQVGKSYIIKYFGENYFENYVEINLEKEPEIIALFKSNKISQIIKLLEIEKNVTITSGNTLIFLDEIQSCPELFLLLRYFYEEAPELHIIAAGSLMEFLFEEHTFSMPVGRIEYMYMGPMLFQEFLAALKQERLIKFINEYKIPEEIPESIHNKLMDLFKEYIFLGGMPESIASYLTEKSYRNAEIVKQSIIQTYREDFVKYRKRINYPLMVKVFNKLPLTIGRKVKYSNIDKEERSKTISDVLHLFSLARIIYCVKHSSANGLPVGAEIKEKIFKNIFLDVGLLLSMSDLTYNDLVYLDDTQLINSGYVSEQVVGQHLLYSQPAFYLPELFYWTREHKKSSAEVDYIIAEKGTVIPIEIKAGKTGTLKSLHQFIKEKKSSFAVRINNDVPSLVQITNKLTTKEQITFKLLSIPMYLTGEIRRLINENYDLKP
jgi:predicted AAA+ superfamily ATPase